MSNNKVSGITYNPNAKPFVPKAAAAPAPNGVDASPANKVQELSEANIKKVENVSKKDNENRSETGTDWTKFSRHNTDPKEVYFKNLPADMTFDQLRDFIAPFSTTGSIIEKGDVFDLPIFEEGKKKADARNGRVYYSNPAHAQAAVANWNGRFQLQSLVEKGIKHRIQVFPYDGYATSVRIKIFAPDKRKEGDSRDLELAFCEHKITDNATGADKLRALRNEIYEKMKVFGKIASGQFSIELGQAKNEKTGKNRNAYVEYEVEESAHEAVKNSKIDVSWCGEIKSKTGGGAKGGSLAGDKSIGGGGVGGGDSNTRKLTAGANQAAKKGGGEVKTGGGSAVGDDKGGSKARDRKGSVNDNKEKGKSGAKSAEKEKEKEGKDGDGWEVAGKPKKKGNR